MQQLVRRWSNPKRAHAETWPEIDATTSSAGIRINGEHQTALVHSLARRGRISSAPFAVHQHNLSPSRAHPSKGDGFLLQSVFFFLSLRLSGARANLRLAIRRTTARPQEALIFQRKRASASRGKKKVRETRGSRKREEKERTARESKSTASTRKDIVAWGLFDRRQRCQRYIPHHNVMLM